MAALQQCKHIEGFYRREELGMSLLHRSVQHRVFRINMVLPFGIEELQG